MKFDFKKISAIAAGLLMTGLTMGIAGAANYPQPFINNGAVSASGVAVVYGTGAGVSALDAVQAGNIQTNLQSYLGTSGGSTGATVSGGDSVALQTPSSFLHVGSSTSSIFGRQVTSSDMPNLLADGTFQDSDNNDHDYTQKVNVSSLTLQQFDLSQYDSSVSESTPVIGIPISSDTNVMNYTLTFQDNVNVSKMDNENLVMMGKEYYVLSASTTKLTLLDSGVSSSLASGGSTTLNVGNQSYDITATIYGTDQVVFSVNNQNTDILQSGDTYKLSDGSYIGVKDIAGATVSGGASIVQFSLGTGKLELINGSDVKVNGDTQNGISTLMNLDTSNRLSSLVLQWDTNDDVALTSNQSITMPVFNSVKLSTSGMVYPATEKTSVKNDGNNAVQISTTVKNGPVSLDVLGNTNAAGNFTLIGKDSRNLLETSSTTSLTYNGTYSGSKFVASWHSGKDAESYVLTANNFVNDSGTIKATIQSKDGGNLDQTVQLGDSITLGNVVLTVGTIDKTAKTIALTANSGTTFNKVYTADGFTITLPTSAVVNATNYTATATGVSTYAINFTEEDKDGNIAEGNSFNVTVGSTGSNNQVTVTNVGGAGSALEVGTSDVYQYTVTSALASTIKWDQGPTQETADIAYHGGESYDTVYLTSSSAIVSGGSSGGSSQLGNVLVMDSEISSVSSDNLIIVGGSCINSAAATALGVPEHTCGAAFTSATGVGSGQFLIKGVSGAFATGKLALVVAGYDVADTVNAAKYLTTQTVDTSKSYIGTTSTSATLQTTTA